MPTGPISVNELQNAFFSIKTNKCPGHDEINFNVIRNCHGELCEPLQYLFSSPFEESIFPDDLKIAKVTPVFKAGINTELSNYIPNPYLYNLASPKYLSALCAIAHTNTYLIQTFSIKNSWASRKDTQPTMQCYSF